MKNSALIWHETGYETVYRDTLHPSCDIWLLMWLDERGITCYEAWLYTTYNRPRVLIKAGCLIEKFQNRSELEWLMFIRDWYWIHYMGKGVVAHKSLS